MREFFGVLRIEKVVGPQGSPTASADFVVRAEPVRCTDGGFILTLWRSETEQLWPALQSAVKATVVWGAEGGEVQAISVEAPTFSAARASDSVREQIRFSPGPQ
jgi:hypothetical protein